MDRDETGDTGCIDLTAARLGKTGTMQHPEIRALLDYWDRLRAGRKVPYRAEVDPRDMSCDARNLFILEDLGQGNIRFRLAGTALVDAFGMELRGMAARSIMEGPARESFTALIEECLAEPGVGYARLTPVREPRMTWEMLLLPMRSDFGRTDRVLGALVPVGQVASRPGTAALRFGIDTMTIRPVGPEATDTPRPVAGFAEVQTRFTGPGPERARATGAARLTAIEGGRSPGPARGTRPRPAGHLRLVKDE